MSESILNRILSELSELRNTMATKRDLERMATKQDLEGMATKQDLEGMATKQDLEHLATKKDTDEIKRTLRQHEGMITQLIQLNGKMHAEMKEHFKQTDRQLSLFDSDLHTLAKQVNEHEFKINRITDVYDPK